MLSRQGKSGTEPIDAISAVRVVSFFATKVAVVQCSGHVGKPHDMIAIVILIALCATAVQDNDSWSDAGADNSLCNSHHRRGCAPAVVEYPRAGPYCTVHIAGVLRRLKYGVFC